MWPLKMNMGGRGLVVGGRVGSGQNIPPLLIADPLVCLCYQWGSKGYDDKLK